MMKYRTEPIVPNPVDNNLNYNKENLKLAHLIGPYGVYTRVQHDEELGGMSIKNIVKANSATQWTCDEL